MKYKKPVLKLRGFPRQFSKKTLCLKNGLFLADFNFEKYM